MKMFDRLKYAFTGKLPQNYSTVFPMGGMLVNDFQDKRAYIKNGYKANAVIYSIISQSSRKFAQVPLYPYEITDKEAYGQYKAMLSGGLDNKSIVKALACRKKAMIPVETHDVIDLLNRPNPLMGTSSFFEALLTFKMLTGAGTVWASRYDPNGPPEELYILPTQDISILIGKNDDGTPDYLMPGGYQLNSGYITQIRKEDILYWKYVNPEWSGTGQHLYGQSPLEAGGMVANERSKADKTSATIMQNQGARGVLYSDTDTPGKGMSTTERDVLQARLDEEINGIRNNGRVALANTKLGYLSLGLSSVELDIDKIKRTSKEDLCNIFSFPPVLLDPSNGTLANFDSSMKAFITNKIMPEWVSLTDELNYWLMPMYKKQNKGRKIVLEADFSVLPEMQEDLQKQVTAIMAMWPLTPNQMLEALGWETDPTNPEMNKRYIPSNLIPLDQMNAMSGDINQDVSKLVELDLLDYK